MPRSDVLGRWKVKTEKYHYRIELEQTGKEVITFHWERGMTNPVPYPHVHFGFTNGDGNSIIQRKSHVPSGRVAVEDVTYFLISELGVHPRKADWRDILAQHREAFIQYKTAE